MRIWSIFTKTMREQARDRWTFLLTIAGAPFFVAIYALFFGSGATTYSVLVLDLDKRFGGELTAQLKAGSQGGQAFLKASPAKDEASARLLLEKREASLLLVIPPGFTEDVGRRECKVKVVGNLTDPNYIVAAILVADKAERFVRAKSGGKPLIKYEESAMGRSGSASGFDLYVPGLLILAMLMAMFPIAMGLVREIERGTVKRLQLSRMTAFDYLAGSCAWHVLVTVAAVVVTLLAAIGFGFRTDGSIPLAILVAALGTFSTVSIALVIVAFCRTATDVSVAGTFPFLFLMFFSGAAIPAPRAELFRVGEFSLALGDLLPQSFAVSAVNKVLTLGSGFGAVLPDLAAMLGVSLVYFAAGVWLFRRRHLGTA
jgi:ABC-2 type transport system permease protein